MSEKLIEAKNLRTYFKTQIGVVRAVDGVDFIIGKRKTIGLVGESGCGKSVFAQSLLQIQQWPGEIVSGEILFYGENGDAAVDLAKYPPKSKELRSIRGKEIAYIHQEPMAALSLLHKVGNQLREAILVHNPQMTKEEADEIGIKILREVGIPGAAERMDSYIFNFSGGMRQRVAIAMALINNPRLLIADEPTTAVDVTIQAQVLELMKNIQQRFAMSIIFITHNLGVIAEIAEEVLVMYLGKIVERGNVYTIFDSPQHPYTKALIGAIPRADQKRGALVSIRGNVPDPYFRPNGCTFSDRCDHYIKDVCDKDIPAMVEIETGHFVRCFLHSREIEKENIITQQKRR